jgi:hypothetical protein
MAGFAVRKKFQRVLGGGTQVSRRGACLVQRDIQGVRPAESVWHILRPETVQQLGEPVGVRHDVRQ